MRKTISNHKIIRAGWFILLFLLLTAFVPGPFTGLQTAEAADLQTESAAEAAESPTIVVQQRSDGKYRFTVKYLPQKNISKVLFAVWSEKNGQDDLHWIDGVYYPDKNKAAVNQSMSIFSDCGQYQIHAYTKDKKGNMTVQAQTTFTVAKPKVESVSAHSSYTSGSFRITATGIQSTLGIKEVSAAVWMKSDQSDLVWYTAEKQSDGSYQFRDSIAKHGYHTGTYTIHIYVTVKQGAKYYVDKTSVDMTTSVGSVSVGANSAKSAYGIVASSVKVPTSTYSVSMAVWSDINGQDDLVWYSADDLGSSKYKARVLMKNHAALGTYHVHIYAKMKNGSMVHLKSTSFEVNTLPSGMIYVTSQDAGCTRVNVFLNVASSDISEVLFPAWHSSDKSDLNWYKATQNSNGSYTALVSSSYHLGHRGTFSVGCYYRDSSGTLHGVSSGTIYVKKPVSGTTQYCRINSSDSTKVSMRVNTNSTKTRTYGLFRLAASESSIPADAKPLARVKVCKTARITVDLNKNTSSSLVNAKLCIGVYNGGRYLIVGTPSYITNPQACADYTYSFPTPSSKKGLQVNTDMLSDAITLGTKHVVLNFPLNSIISTGSTSVSYNYNGKTYYFDPGYISYLDSTTSRLASGGAITTAVILMQYDSSLMSLIIPSGRSESDHAFYGLNTQNETSREWLAATFTFLAKRYSDQSHKVVNWVMGNEVGDYNQYYWCGNITKNTYVKYYSDAFRTLYNSVRSVYKYARVYISLDQCWNYDRSDTYTGKSMFTSFVSQLKKEGDINWCIAFHPYPVPLTTANFWSSNGLVTNSSDSPCITMKNLIYLTNYIKANYGTSHRFILSETGFTSTGGENVQAAAIAYAYYIAEGNDMVDSLVIHRHVDHLVEVAQGLRLGLWYNGSSQDEYASSRKQAYEIFYRMDRKGESLKYTNFALSVIGASRWEDIVPGFDASRYS